MRCQHKSTEAIKCCLKCKQLKEYTSDYTALCADSGHQCLHTESFKLCFKCKELKEYTTSNPSFGEDTKCVHCDSMDTELIKRCTKCKQLKEYKSMASASKSCVACGCKSTESFNRCTSCKLPKVTAVASHAIQKCTLKNMEKESGDGARDILAQATQDSEALAILLYSFSCLRLSTVLDQFSIHRVTVNKVCVLTESGITCGIFIKPRYISNIACRIRECND